MKKMHSIVNTSIILVITSKFRCRILDTSVSWSYQECFAKRWTKLGGEHPQSQITFHLYKRHLITIPRFPIGFKSSAKHVGWSKCRVLYFGENLLTYDQCESFYIYISWIKIQYSSFCKTCSFIILLHENASHILITTPLLCLVEKVSGGISSSCQYR